MSLTAEKLAAIFREHGDDFRAGLADLAVNDPDAYAEFAAAAAFEQYQADLAAYREGVRLAWGDEVGQ